MLLQALHLAGGGERHHRPCGTTTGRLRLLEGRGILERRRARLRWELRGWNLRTTAGRRRRQDQQRCVHVLSFGFSLHPLPYDLICSPVSINFLHLSRSSAIRLTSRPYCRSSFSTSINLCYFLCYLCQSVMTN